MRKSLLSFAGAGLACLFALSGVVSGSILGAGPAHAAGDAAPMAAAPGMLKKTGHEGPWRYGCAFPDKGSTARGVTCTLGRLLTGEERDVQGRAGRSHPDGLLMFLHSTSDSVLQNQDHQQAGSQPWALAFLLPTAEEVDRAVPARLMVDEGAAISIPWQGCNAQGCSAQRTGLADTVMVSLNHGRQAQIVAQKPDGGRLVFSISLASYQAAMRRMDFWASHDELKP